MTADPFGTAALRRAVLDAWRASPTRRREDANLEEDHARGYYRDRVVVELAQNAADAATRAGVPGRVTFHLDTTTSPATLRVTNVGAPLDAAGVASLASLRASSKGEGSVGRFGVGFAAVRAVSDDITICSITGGIRFATTLADQAAHTDLGGSSPSERQSELPFERRTAAPIAVLRLPFPAAPATGGETEVEVVLRDADAVAVVRAQLDGLDDALLLALPALDRVEIDVDGEAPRVLDGVADRWLTRHAEGHLTSADVAELPVEQRRTAWSVLWALPRSASERRQTREHRVLHAPTPTDVPLTFPAVLIATFPVDPGRRRVLPGAATDRLAAEAGRAYAALLGDVAAAGDADGQGDVATAGDADVRGDIATAGDAALLGDVASTRGADLLGDVATARGADALDLVPAGLPAGELDAAIREAALDALATTPLLATPTGLSGDRRAREPHEPDSAAGLGGVSGMWGAGVRSGPDSAGLDEVSGSWGAGMRPGPDSAGLDEVSGSWGAEVRSGADTLGEVRRVAPREAVLLAGPVGEDDDVAAAVGTVPLAVRHHAIARRLGAQVVPLADALDDLAGSPPARWRAVYAALAPHLSDPAVREALAGAPVPLADGRVARGARGLVLPDSSVHAAGQPLSASSSSRADGNLPGGSGGVSAGEWGVLGLRVVHPDAAHPVLERVGAVRFDPRAVLADPAVRSAALTAASDVLDDDGDAYDGGDGRYDDDDGGGDAYDDDGGDAYDDDGGREHDDDGGADAYDDDGGRVPDDDGGRRDTADNGFGDLALDDGRGPQAVVDAVLRLVSAVVDAVGPGSGDAVPFWVGELPVRADGGVPVPLRETAVPGTWAADHLDGLAVVDDAEVNRHGETVLIAAGAHAVLDVYRVGEAVTPAPDEPDEEHDPLSPTSWLADWSAYLEHLADLWGSDVLLDDVEAIADLDAVAEESWPQALALIAEQPDLRRALLTPVRPGAGARPGAAPAPSYASWWLRRRFGAPFALHDGVPLLPAAPAATRGLDAAVVAAIGGVGSLAEQRAEDWPVVLDALGPVGSEVAVRDALALWAGLAAVAVGAEPGERAGLLELLPDRLPGLVVGVVSTGSTTGGGAGSATGGGSVGGVVSTGSTTGGGAGSATGGGSAGGVGSTGSTTGGAGGVLVADADEVVVAPGRRWAQLGPVLPAPAGAAEAVAELLDLPLAAEQRPDDDGQARPIDSRVVALDGRLPAAYQHHDDLRVGGTPVRFWVFDGDVHATDDGALADALADLLGAPHRAAALREVLSAPERAAAVWASLAWE
ncbi:hypothetical protein Xcel_2928 [Xylanimonas cellulosilytica DSM 15894]|uniref:ATP-binding region ATPase domain protein n=1 Tax=Xylanimonas cellulosilytica (strain DSM 15894 / JCM 12276 / CECT 5975 / KCTC 9989 / LMG 20990 / NBRC 107835 / XIL07) TaxID=446471 RepID=D1BZ38_XYLCX|nr:ATP-binding protein [Xylanimonas cellulosilytica]ACZ31935.1 hypothetical protein Xcel_2928 [Xylanimonas cellulosilytica DSM 15894]